MIRCGEGLNWYTDKTRHKGHPRHLEKGAGAGELGEWVCVFGMWEAPEGLSRWEGRRPMRAWRRKTAILRWPGFNPWLCHILAMGSEWQKWKQKHSTTMTYCEDSVTPYPWKHCTNTEVSSRRAFKNYLYLTMPYNLHFDFPYMPFMTSHWGRTNQFLL